MAALFYYPVSYDPPAYVYSVVREARPTEANARGHRWPLVYVLWICVRTMRGDIDRCVLVDNRNPFGRDWRVPPDPEPPAYDPDPG